MTTVLVVEDEIEIARVVRDYLRNAGFEVIVVGDGGSAVASVRSAKPDLLVLDLGLPGREHHDRGVRPPPDLAREPGRVFTRSQLLDAVHGVAIESYERAIDAHVKNIRRKIEPTPGSPRYLVTVHGVGYRFADA